MGFSLVALRRRLSPGLPLSRPHKGGRAYGSRPANCGGLALQAPIRALRLLDELPSIPVTHNTRDKCSGLRDALYTQRAFYARCLLSVPKTRWPNSCPRARRHRIPSEPHNVTTLRVDRATKI